MGAINRIKSASRRAVGYIRLAVVFAWHILLANFFVARICLSPRVEVHPGIVALPLQVKSEGAITALTLMLTVTPGAVPIDVSRDREEIYIHCLDLNELDSVKHSKDVFEKLLLEVEA